MVLECRSRGIMQAAAWRMINTGNKFGLEEQIRSRQLSRAGMNKTSVGDLLGCLAQGGE